MVAIITHFMIDMGRGAKRRDGENIEGKRGEEKRGEEGKIGKRIYGKPKRSGVRDNKDKGNKKTRKERRSEEQWRDIVKKRR